jgi:hypothetical protein
MDDQGFDALAKALFKSSSRRRTLGGLLAGALALVGGQEVAAKKCNQKDKKKRRKCRKKSKGNPSCPRGSPVCDPARSTLSGCGAPGNPVCCASTGASHPAEATCCNTASAGQGGVCLAGTHPHCCPFVPGVGSGCCEAGLPTCCTDGIGGYCCPPSTVCCPETPSGCCLAQVASADVSVESVENAPRRRQRTASDRP